MTKLTAEEILTLAEKHLTVDQFAHGDFNDGDFFTDYSEELQRHIDATKGMSGRERRVYEQGIEYTLYTAKRTEYQEAGSPKIVGKFKEVDSGGGMDMGSDWYSVKYFKDHDVYIRTDGYYQSHHGTDFEYGYGEEVFPTQKTITVYE